MSLSKNLHLEAVFIAEQRANAYFEWHNLKKLMKISMESNSLNFGCDETFGKFNKLNRSSAPIISLLGMHNIFGSWLRQKENLLIANGGNFPESEIHCRFQHERKQSIGDHLTSDCFLLLECV